MVARLEAGPPEGKRKKAKRSNPLHFFLFPFSFFLHQRRLEMNKHDLPRRGFLAATSAGAVAALASRSIPAIGSVSTRAGKLAILGRRAGQEEQVLARLAVLGRERRRSVVKTTKSGIWCRIQSESGTVPTFEKEFAKLTGDEVLRGHGLRDPVAAHLRGSPGNRPGRRGHHLALYRSRGPLPRSCRPGRCPSWPTWTANPSSSTPTTSEGESPRTPRRSCRFT